ncbi:cytochrome bd oxidase small subunit CydS [Alteribacillus iranensis]|uniref:Cytochrome oxidase maturation protein, cbb3-type n=1 Tax=Alteribacillus iranensis TaxID=930128 RepID=A0A1I2DV66_9BACI|nr:cytochrome oxidase maturation protein, cbb3-type [Alteribacillus iranensis]
MDLNHFLIMVAPHLTLAAAVLAIFLWSGRQGDYFEDDNE